MRKVTLQAANGQLRTVAKISLQQWYAVIEDCQAEMTAARKAGRLADADTWYARGRRAIDISNDLRDALS